MKSLRHLLSQTLLQFSMLNLGKNKDFGWLHGDILIGFSNLPIPSKNISLYITEKKELTLINMAKRKEGVNMFILLLFIKYLLSIYFALERNRQESLPSWSLNSGGGEGFILLQALYQVLYIFSQKSHSNLCYYHYFQFEVEETESQ